MANKHSPFDYAPVTFRPRTGPNAGKTYRFIYDETRRTFVLGAQAVGFCIAAACVVVAIVIGA